MARLYSYVDESLVENRENINFKKFASRNLFDEGEAFVMPEKWFQLYMKSPFFLAIKIFTSKELLADTPLGRGIRAHFNVLVDKDFDGVNIGHETKKSLFAMFYPYHDFIINENTNKLPFELIRFYILRHFNVEPSIKSIFSIDLVLLKRESDGRIEVNVSRKIRFRNPNQMDLNKFISEINKTVSENTIAQAKSLFLSEQGDFLRNRFWDGKVNAKFRITAFNYLDFSLNDIQNLAEEDLVSYLEYLLSSKQSKTDLDSADRLKYFEAVDERIAFSDFDLISRINRAKAQTLFEQIVKNRDYRVVLSGSLDRLANRIGFQVLQKLLRKSPNLRPYLELYRMDLIDFLKANGQEFTQNKSRIKFPTLKKHLQNLGGTRKANSLFFPVNCSQSSR